jgi:hypothetical protein
VHCTDHIGVGCGLALNIRQCQNALAYFGENFIKLPPADRQEKFGPNQLQLQLSSSRIRDVPKIIDKQILKTNFLPRGD